MTRKRIIEDTLQVGLSPDHLEVVDESHRHSVPAGAESHFNLLVVSGVFEGMGRVTRHRRVHELLAPELAGGLHALTLTLLTPAEFAAKGEAIASPACRGGSKSAPA